VNYGAVIMVLKLMLFLQMIHSKTKNMKKLILLAAVIIASTNVITQKVYTVNA